MKPLLAALATAGVLLAPVAHADVSSDYLDCVPKYGLSITDKAKAAKVGQEMVDVLRSHQLTPDPQVETFYVEHHYNVPPFVATVIVDCAQIAALKNGGY